MEVTPPLVSFSAVSASKFQPFIYPISITVKQRLTLDCFNAVWVKCHGPGFLNEFLRSKKGISPGLVMRRKYCIFTPLPRFLPFGILSQWNLTTWRCILTKVTIQCVCKARCVRIWEVGSGRAPVVAVREPCYRPEMRSVSSCFNHQSHLTRVVMKLAKWRSS